ncbi:MAG: hypothetical protein LAP86_29470 [Acidobacteriia bacterium]|nr:hypothetical protein [Terriglobia bacterium]
MRVLLLGRITAITVCSLAGTCLAQTVEVSLRTDKSAYKAGDQITLDVLLTNKSRKPVYIYAYLARGESASLSVWLKDTVSGKDIPQLVVADSITPPPASQDAFIKLLPWHVYGVMLKSRLSDLGVDKKGSYEVVAQYHSPIPPSNSFGLPILSTEDGTLSSNRVQITVAE